MKDQDQPFAYLARPHWERDDVQVFPDLESLVTRCDDGKTFVGPDAAQVVAVYRDGQEVELSRDVYSVPDPASKEEAEEFVRRRLAAGPIGKIRGLFRANPDSPFDDQVAQYIKNSPWRWKAMEELTLSNAVSHGGKAL